MKKIEEIKELREKLFNEFNIETDRDLVKQLKLSAKDKTKLYTWIRYQCAFAYNAGYDEGREELREDFNNLLNKKI